MRSPHNGVAYEHFLPSGPFAILPMTGNRSSLVWTEAKTKAPALLALDEAGFNDELARRFGSHLGETKSAGPRWSYPLSFHLARDFVRPRFALAGDCAHGIHPIAGQGLNLGLKDAAALAEVLLDAARLGRDIGALDTLKRYERWRRFDSFALAASTDALNRLFSNDIAPLRHLRDLGLGIVDSIGPARRFFMRHAGGDIGKLPRLMKGEGACWLGSSSDIMPPRLPRMGSMNRSFQRCSPFARRHAAAFRRAGQGGRQFLIETPRHHAHPLGAHFLGLLAGGKDLRFEQIMGGGAGLDFLHLFHLLIGHIQGMAEMGIGVGLVALLLGDARDIGRVEPLQPGQAEAVKADANQHKSTRPKNICHCVSP